MGWTISSEMMLLILKKKQKKKQVSASTGNYFRTLDTLADEKAK